MPNGECPIGADLRARMANVELTNKDQWAQINKNRDEFDKALRMAANRLPNWAVVVGWALGIVLGVFGTLIATAR